MPKKTSPPPDTQSTTLPPSPPPPTCSDWELKAKQYEDNWKRALADYQNLLRRVETERKQFTKLSNVNLLAKLLPSLDILDVAASHTKDLGVEMAAKQFRQTLTEEGLSEIVPQIGDVFDHHSHECVDTVSTTDPSQDNRVSELSLKGYKIGEFVVRPARVKVYKLSPPAPSVST